MEIKLPYFDEILARIEATPHSELVQALGTRHVHWGYYADPTRADTSTTGLAAAAEALTARLVAAAAVNDGQRILDAGCGFGGTLAHINEHFSNVSLTGLNIDPRQLALARRLVQPRSGNDIAFIEGDACKMMLPEQSFDTVLAVECIFHFPGRLRFFQEARRVLKTGGRLALSDFVPYGPAFSILAPFVLRYRLAIERFYGRFNCYRPCPLLAYRALAHGTGFRLISDEDITRNTLPTYSIVLTIIRELGHREAEHATELVEYVSRKGYVRYRIMAFEAV